MGPENVVLRGTKLKNTDSVYGCVVYTGPDTKMSQNSQKKGNKFSSIEVALNKYLLSVLFLLFAEITLSVILKYTWSVDKPGSKTWYLNETVDDGNKSIFLHILEDVLSFLVLYNYMIPISLYVTLEFQKFCGSLLLAWDLELYDELSDQPAKCNTSDLMEELGQVIRYNPISKIFLIIISTNQTYESSRLVYCYWTAISPRLNTCSRIKRELLPKM